MTRFSRSLFCVPLVAAAVLVLGSCGGSSEPGSGEQAEGEQLLVPGLHGRRRLL